MLKLLVEFGPLVVFLLTYKYSDILLATALMICVTVLCLFISYLIDRKLSSLLLVSSGILLLMGAITLLTGNPMYIKMKPTIAYLVLSSSLFLGIRNNKPLAKHVFGELVSLSNKDWLILSRRLAIYLIGMAVLNEIIWRNFSENTWVSFKVFGALPITMLFAAMQIPFVLRNMRDAPIPNDN